MLSDNRRSLSSGALFQSLSFTHQLVLVCENPSPNLGRSATRVCAFRCKCWATSVQLLDLGFSEVRHLEIFQVLLPQSLLAKLWLQDGPALVARLTGSGCKADQPSADSQQCRLSAVQTLSSADSQQCRLSAVHTLSSAHSQQCTLSSDRQTNPPTRRSYGQWPSCPLALHPRRKGREKGKEGKKEGRGKESFQPPFFSPALRSSASRAFQVAS
ncbi:hypothetical protein EDD86DRAFT_43549 [Gorgonomyces haynaldii]|nr:hypothetical protein EDD86DRAFT_43549 [Gorgonomyces haynaldii]